MRANRRFAICTAAVISISMVSSLSAAAADNTLSVDMTDNNNEAWADIAMANDDTVTTGVIVRTGSDQNSGVAGYLYRGDAVKVIDKGDTWTRISSGSVTGYVKNDYLTYGTDAKGLAEYYGTYGVKASWNDVNVFASNNSASKIVSEANDGDTFKYVSTDGHFIEVKDDNDNTVYVSDEDVDPVILLSTASSASEDDHSSAAASAPGTSADTASADASSNDDASGTGSTDITDENTSGTEGTDVSGEAESYTETTDASYDEGTGTSYTDSSDTESTDTSYTEGTETSYTEGTETSYTENTETSSSDNGDTSYTGTSSADYSFDGSGYSSAQEAANAAYQVYLNAQAAADAAVANGAGSDEINSTAAAATAAYSTFLQYQNAADAEAANTPAGTVSDTSGSDSAPAQTAGTDTYTDSTEADTQTDTSSDNTEQTEAPAEDTSGSGSPAASSDLNLLAAVIYCEAGNQPYEGMVAVGAVVMNRVYSSSFPNSISEVLYQGGQFTTAGMLEGVLANGSVPSSCYSAAQDALNGSDPTGGCLYFNTSHGSGVHIGAHWFY